MNVKKKRIISFLIAFTMILSSFNFSFLVNNKVYAEEEITIQSTATVNDAIKVLIDCMNKDYRDKVYEQLNGEEYAAMYKAGADLKKTSWKINKDTSKYGLEKLGLKVTQALALMDLDEDPTIYKNVNLISDIAKEIGNIKSARDMGRNEVKALVLLERYNDKYKDKKVNYNVENAILNLVKAQDKDGAINSAPHHTAMAIYVLNKHKDIEGVNNCINNALNYLSLKYNKNGALVNSKFFTAYNAEAVMWFSQIGEDLKEDKWIKNGKGIIETLFNLWNGKTFVDYNGKIKHTDIPKVLSALVALKEAGYGDYEIKGVKFENFKKHKPENNKNGSSIDSVIKGVIDYYNTDHFVKNHAQLVNYEYSAMYKAGADLKKKPWFLVEKYESSYDQSLKYLASKVHQSTILLDLDKDANNYEKINLINEIAKEIDESSSFFNQVKLQAVIAIDKYNEKFKDKKVDYNTEHAVEKILQAQCEDGGFKERKSSALVNTAYALTALSKHKNIKGVNEAIDKGIKYLHAMQKDDGGIYENSFVTGYCAEIIRGLISVGENPTSKQWTKSSGKNLVDALFTLWKDNNSFDGKKTDSINIRGYVEATWKALYALVDLKDAGFGEYIVDGVKVKGISDGEVEKEEKTCKVNVCISIPENGKYIAYTKPEEVAISDKKHSKGFTALGALQAKTTLFTMTGEMVTSIYGYENKDQNGWMYSVNGVIPNVMPEKLSVKPGDKIIFFYSMNSMKGKAPRWEELIQIKEEKPEEKLDDATIEPKKVEVFSGEDISFKVLCDKGNYLVYTSEVPGVESGYKKIGNSIKINIPKDTKAGVYKLVNLQVYNVDEGKLENYQDPIKQGLLEKMLNDKENKVAKLKDVTVVVKEKQVEHKDYVKQVNEAINSSASLILKGEVKSFQAIALKVSGFEVPISYTECVKEKLRNKDASLIDESGKFKATELEKIIIGLVSSGEDPRSIEGFNLVEELSNMDLLNIDNVYTLSYALLALDSGKFSLTKDSKYTRLDLLNKIISMKFEGGWGFGTVDVDTTWMVLAVLSNYKNKDFVKKTIDESVKVLSKMQNENGEYISPWNENGSSESLSQAIIALCALDIDPTSKMFTKGDKNLLDCLFGYKSNDGGFVHTKEKLDFFNELSTEQALTALAAYNNFKNNKKGSIYNIKEFEGEKVTKDLEIKNLTNTKEFKLGTEAKVTIKAVNNCNEEKSGALVVGLFNNDGKLINYASAEQIIKSKDNVILKVWLKLPNEGEYTIKAFLWDNLDNMKPLSNVIEIPVK
ncbi:DUF4430 domain-containing protein [Clostridium rectalis]|uniref:DUF4430 domain-containing protein n=1 Tax=Clostridium rectalis TaxID=2040295 RepID=UPI0013DE04E9|nr:DUF4430 domain-containing protein [Clostridium rectalis]